MTTFTDLGVAAEIYVRGTPPEHMRYSAYYLGLAGPEPVFGRQIGRMESWGAGGLVLMLLIGLWHSITWASAVFGLYHGVSLVLHRLVERRRPPRRTPVLRITKSVLVFGWFALSLPLLQLDLHEALDFYAAMIGIR